MNFVHPWALLLLSLPLMWISWWWRSTVRRSTLVLKGLSFAAIFLALAEPFTTLPRTKTGAVVLVDTSESITHEDLDRASSIVAQIG
ncbi:MAG: hypothetical protein JO061_06065, partial [Acidobacteriaceae bacterium]|nr:hypothetical protein [Acidobacteriaceae bacterium]